MIKGIERFAELYERLGVQFEILKGILWVEYNSMVVPVGPAKLSYSISEEEARFLLSKFPKTLLVRHTDGFGNKTHGEEWYAVICDEASDLNELPAKNRSEIKRGLKNCKAKMVEASFIVKQGYNVFISASERYKGVKNPGVTEEDFKRRILITKDFADIVHYWGVFHENKLIAYSVNYIYDNIEANYSTIKFHPDFLKLYPSYALIYTMNKYYLQERHFEYVNDGFRNILHQTGIQKFLMDKFKFRRAYTNLYVVYKPYLSICLSITFPMRSFIEKANLKLAALYKLEEIRRKCQNAK